MKRIFSFFLILLASLISYSQVATDQYYIQFTDKDNNPYSLSNPSEYLSAKAIERRATQNIEINETDLPINPSYIDSVITIGAQIVNRLKWFNGLIIRTQDSITLNKILNFSFVSSITKTSVFKNTNLDNIDGNDFEGKSSIENLYNATISDFGLKNSNILDYGASYNQIHMLNGDSLHSMGYLGDGIVIAILDAGFAKVDELAAFDSVWLNNRVLGTYDFVENSEIAFNAHTHGTSVFSILAANLPGQIIGSAPNASYYLLRTEIGSAENLVEEYHWLAGAQWADSAGADIITSSLGYTIFDNHDMDHIYSDLDGNTTPITIAADLAASKGILVVNSAGNYANNPWKYIGAPADGDSVLAVGAVNAEEQWATFSSLGPSSDGRIKPNVVAKGQSTIMVNINGIVQAGNGTSFSAPVISGLAACLWQSSPSLTNMQIFRSIEKSAHLWETPNDTLGYGLPDFAYAKNILSVLDNESSFNNMIELVYPNPFTSNFSLVFNSSIHGKVILKLFDINGKLILEDEKLLSRGENKIDFGNLNYLRKGHYFVQIINSDFSDIKKLIKQ